MASLGPIWKLFLMGIALQLAVLGCQGDATQDPGPQATAQPQEVVSESSGMGDEEAVPEATIAVSTAPPTNTVAVRTATPTNTIAVSTAPPTSTIAVSKPTPTSTDHGIRIIREGVPDPHPFFPCGPFMGPPGVLAQFASPVLLWTPDGLHVVFGHDGVVWKVEVQGSQTEMLLDANPGSGRITGPYEFLYGFHADLSPDGTRLAYTSCQFSTEYGSPAIDKDRRDMWRAEWYERSKHHYEIAVVGLNGDAQQRLTHNVRLDHHPVWSPDGERIAFISNSSGHADVDLRGQRIYTMAADGSDVQSLAFGLRGVALYPPVWSPDGQRVAFIVNEGERLPGDRLTLYTVRSDGSDLIRIGETAVRPAWSPDSELLAFVRDDGEEAVIHTVQWDGMDFRRIWSSSTGDSLPLISQVSWSPDGADLLVVSYGPEGVFTVGLNGNGLRSLVATNPIERIAAAWSPDGSRVAVYSGGEVLTVARDGTDLQSLTRVPPSHP